MSDNSLRGQLVEAIAHAISEVTGVDWEQFPVEAEAALDAALVFLTENAVAWKQAAYEKFPETDPDVFGAAAIAVLRDIRETP